MRSASQLDSTSRLTYAHRPGTQAGFLWQNSTERLSQTAEIKTRKKPRYTPTPVTKRAWPCYEFNRAVCSINPDANFAVGKPSDTASRKGILHDLRVAQRRICTLRDLREQPCSASVREWLQLNGSSLKGRKAGKRSCLRRPFPAKINAAPRSPSSPSTARTGPEMP
jgi:hypothetical protein